MLTDIYIEILASFVLLSVIMDLLEFLLVLLADNAREYQTTRISSGNMVY